MFVWRRAWLYYLNIQSYHTIIFCYIGKKGNAQFVVILVDFVYVSEWVVNYKLVFSFLCIAL